jgi:hypothetical protein
MRKFILCPSCHGIRLNPDGHTPCSTCKGKGFVFPSKFHSFKQKVDDITFDSMGEAERYGELKLMEKSGLISDLEIKPVYELKINNQLICKYIPDFRYKFPSGKVVVEDFKGVKTKLYLIKKRLMKTILGIEVQESKKKG